MACGYDYIIFYSCFRKATYLHVTTPTVLFLNLCEIHAQNVALAALFFFFFNTYLFPFTSMQFSVLLPKG